MRWFDDYNEVLRLGLYLVEEGFDAGRLQAYYEKPWKWDDAYEELVALDRQEKAAEETIVYEEDEYPF